MGVGGGGCEWLHVYEDDGDCYDGSEDDIWV